ncbi:alpha/beta-hydrolase [Hymenopellis radicata]|nr:alpha/beta-hydrolase [Hymenopellis radicata]
MIVATIDAEGTQYAFTDSGPIHGQDYKTLLMFHGTIFNRESFEPLVPSFNKQGIRVINVSRRGYGETFEHSASDIANLAEGRDEFLKVLARDVANLLIWVLDNLGPFEEHSLSMLSWSMGTSTTLSLLGQRDIVSPETYARIGRYLEKLVLHDSSLTAFGFDIPTFEGLYNPFLDRSFPTIQEYSDNINMYLSLYFDHPDLQSRQPSGVNFSRNGTRPTMARMTPEYIARVMESKAAATGADAGAVPYPPIQRMLREQANTALFNPDLVLPSVTIATIGCMHTSWFLLWAFIELERRHKEFIERGVKVRPITFVELTNANHFVHHDAPEDFVGCVAKVIKD